jgi:4-hydroxy-3-methylbut-2-enyl diphosphate reductase
VRRAHAVAQRLHAQGYHVVVIGKPDHVEVRGLTEDLPACDVIASVAAGRALPATRLGVLSQTTVPPDEAATIVAALRRANPQAEVHYVDTACEPTKQRLAAVAELVPRVDAMVVVGGRGSNNTRKLAQLAERLGARTVMVEGAGELEAAQFAGCRVVGLTAGTSTLDSTIAAVRAALEAMPVRD